DTRKSARQATASEVVERDVTEDNKENEGLCKPLLPSFPSVKRLGAVRSVFRRLRRWSLRKILIRRVGFRVCLGCAFGSPPGFHRGRKLRATFWREIQFFLRFLDAARFRRAS